MDAISHRISLWILECTPKFTVSSHQYWQDVSYTLLLMCSSKESNLALKDEVSEEAS
jgi:hypothetical protein